MAKPTGPNQDAPEKPTELGEVASTPGENVGGQFVAELRDEVLKGRGNSDLAVYEQVMRDDQVRSCYEQLRTAVIARQWKVDPGGPDPIDVAAADFLRDQMTRVGWDRVTERMFAGFFYGYAVGELLYATEGSQVVLTGLKVRRAKRFDLGPIGEVYFRSARDSTLTLMPASKFWVFSTGADDDDNPRGMGLAYFLYWLVWFKRHGMKFYAQFCEFFAGPTPIVRHPPGARAEDVAKYLEIAGAVRAGGRVAIPNSIALELIQAAQSSGGVYSEFCRYLDAGIAKVILQQTMTSDNGSSLSQAKVHEAVKEDVAKARASALCESFVRGPGSWLCAWNFPGAKIPIVSRDFEEGEDLLKRAERDKGVYSLGYRPTQEYIDKTYGPGWVPSTPAPPASGAGDGPPATPPQPVQFAEGPKVGGLPAPRESLDRILERDNWERLIGPEVESVMSFVDGAGSLDEVRTKLGELAKRDPAAVTDALSRVMFAAHVAGAAGAEFDEGNGDGSGNRA